MSYDMIENQTSIILRCLSVNALAEIVKTNCITLIQKLTKVSLENIQQPIKIIEFTKKEL